MQMLYSFLYQVYYTCSYQYFTCGYLLLFSFYCSRTKLQRPELNDGHLLEILRQKDSQIVGMESIDREKQRELDLKKSELEKLQSELKVYKDLIGVRAII